MAMEAMEAMAWDTPDWDMAPTLDTPAWDTLADTMEATGATTTASVMLMLKLTPTMEPMATAAPSAMLDMVAMDTVAMAMAMPATRQPTLPLLLELPLPSVAMEPQPQWV